MQLERRENVSGCWNTKTSSLDDCGQLSSKGSRVLTLLLYCVEFTLEFFFVRPLASFGAINGPSRLIPLGHYLAPLAIAK